MFTIKRNWIYEAKWTFFAFAGVMSLLLLLSFMSNQDIYRYVITTTFTSLYQVTNVLLILFPLYALVRISPKMGRYTDSPVLTSHLPFSKKQLWLLSIKNWFIAFPLYLTLSTVCYIYLQQQLPSEYASFWQLELIGALVGILFVMGSFSVQVMAALITTLAKQLSWYKIIPAMIVGNIAYILIAIAIALILKLDGDNNVVAYTYIGIVLLIYSLLNVITFIKSYKYLEFIYQ